MRELEKISEELFQKIRSRFDSVSIGDENAKTTQDPETARFFNFDYVSKDGTNFGNVTISLIDENSLKVYYSKNITDNLDQIQTREWFEFLKGLRLFAKRNLLTFDTRDIMRSNLSIKDLKQQSKSDSSYSADEIKIAESRMYGTSRSSYDRMGETKLIIRHSKEVDENKIGSRARNIESIYVETADGERFRLPFTNLTGARAIGQHIAQGGTMFDERAEHIRGMVKELAALGTFIRATRNQIFEDDLVPTMIEASKKRYQKVRTGLRSMRGPRGYGFYWGSINHDDAADGGIGEDEIKNKFTRRIFDERLEEALPYVRRAYSQHLSSQDTNLSRDFENWADSVVEGTWALPDNDDKLMSLEKLMSKPLKVGVDAAESTSALYNLVGDDELFDLLGDLAEKDPEANIWDDAGIVARLEDLGIEVKKSETQQVPSQPSATDLAPAIPATESADDLAMIKWLSGIQK